MKGYYFTKHEEIRKREGRAMIIMDVKVDNLYAFSNFHINMSYPKKIVESSIPGEYLKEKPNFRYKKVNIIMGGNATGKTTLGKLLMVFVNYFKDGGSRRFVKIIDDRERAAYLEVEFVTDEDILYRFVLHISPKKDEEEYKEDDIDIVIYKTNINKKDNYETCSKRLAGLDCEMTTYDKINTQGWLFLYPQDAQEDKTYYSIEEDARYLYILECMLKTLDPSIKEVIKVKEVENTYAVKFKNRSVIIKDGQIAESDVLSSGTKAGLDISYIIASLIANKHDLYYCDERFTYVNSDVEKACLSIIIGKLTDRKQLFFTTHNMEILDMQLPKHAYTFLKKDVNNDCAPIQTVNAADYLKRNTDSIKNAVENDLFCIAPELHRLYEIADL